MGLQLPAALTEPLGWIGMTWPEADEELLFEAGQQWIQYSVKLTTITSAADQSAAQVWQTNSGDAVDAFHKWWTNPDGPELRLVEDAIAAQVIGTALIIFAAVTLALKIAFIVQLAILAVEVAQAIATAVASFGATTAEVPGFIAATRTICRRLVNEVVSRVKTVIGDILKKAKDLLKRVEKKMAQRATRRAEYRFEEKLASDLRKVNPNFKPPDPAYSANCTHCVQAYEMRRRGMDVQATALPQQFHMSGGRPLGDVEQVWGRNFTPGTQSQIENAFQQAGPGSRGVVYIKWNNSPGAHVFNVENAGGKVRFVDAQTGATDVAHYFSQGSGTSFLRLDDATPTSVGPFIQPAS